MRYLKEKATLTAYASDGSAYAVTPWAVRPVLNFEDIWESVDFARKTGLTITPRGAGTGLAGGAIGSGLILDFGQYKRVLEINPGQMTVLTEVGIVYDELNLALEKHRLFFPPDPASGDTCQIGGMIANNSSGPRSVKYGLTSDFVEELNIISASGRLINLRKLKIGSPGLLNFFEENPEYAVVYDLLQKNRELIENRWPKVKKNSSGYNLLQVVKGFEDGVFDLPALMVGSEGTLSLFVSAKLRLLPKPGDRLTARLYFKSLVDAGRAVSFIQKLDPSGLEIVDGATLDLIGRQSFNIPDSAAALLLVEFDEDIEEVRQRFTGLATGMDLAAPTDFADDPEATAALWKARKAIVPMLYRHHPSRRPVALVEDVSVPPDRIPDFIEYVTSLFRSDSLTFGMFGHIGDGNLHIRPLLDLNDSADFDLARQIYDNIYDRVISMGGSITGEHADGRLRAGLVKKLYGEEIYAIFKEIKSLLDPGGIFSADSILGEKEFTADIDYEKLKSYCAACGKCNGYCPAYDLFRREDFSPRGWLRILNQSGESRRKIDRYLSYCLNCKNCADVCPAEVDIASEIIEYRSRHPSTVSKIAVTFADSDPLLNLALRLGWLSNPLMSSSIGRSLAALFGKPLFGFDRRVRFPSIAKKSLRKRFSDRISHSGKVAFFHGCADNLLESGVGEAVFKVFDRLGVEVVMPEQKCCGLPQDVCGHRDNLVQKARFNIDALNHFDCIITGCASCLLRLREYEKLFDADSRYRTAAERLASKCFDISQYINSLGVDYSIFDSDRVFKLTYHNPCHMRAAGIHREPEKLMRKLNNVEIHDPVHADRCCAQAGSYGFTHFQESKRIFEKKRDDFNQIDAEYIMTSCPACQMKIRSEMNGNFKVVHPVEILAERLQTS